ncbi:lipopolysaccharide biosynthesis protein [Sphingobacterium kitahiroshimense]|uniref:lipopolysaccharide biosynthesis protein n=1 Tax=Sphingobacterium kitahiroshimense TaxID=470446 RepID=UPI003208AEFE
MNELKHTKELNFKELILLVQDWIKYLLSKWYVLVIAGMIGGLLGYFYANRKEPVYTATTTFVLETGESGGGMGQMAGLAALAGLDVSGGSNNLFQGDNLFVLYKSRTMLEQALLSPNPIDTTELLINQYIRFNKLNETDLKNETLSKIDFKKGAKTFDRPTLRFRDSLLGVITESIVKNNLVIDKIDKKSSIIKVEINAKNEQFAKSFNEVLVSTVNNFYVKTKTKKSLDNIAILQTKTDSVRAAMNGNIATAAVITDATPNLNPTKLAQRLIPTQKSQFSAETNKAILGQLVQNLEMSKMNLLKEAPLIETIDEPIYPLQVYKFSKAKGIIFGVVICVFFALAFLSARRLYLQILE